MVRINDATGANISVRKDFSTMNDSMLLVASRFIIPFMPNTIIFMVTGGDVQDNAVNGNLSMVMSNDR